MGPPAALILLLAYGAGLATGLARFPDPRFVLFAACVVGLWRPRGRVVAGVIALSGGVLAGLLASRVDPRTCTRMWRAGAVQLSGVLRGPGSPGPVIVDADGTGCGGAVTVLWPDNRRAASGSTVTVRGRWIPRRAVFGRVDGILVAREVSVHGRHRRRISDAIHESVAARSRVLFGDRAALVDALVTGRRGSMSQEIRTSFTASGLVHLLSISGFHVGLIAGWVLLVLHLLRVPRHQAEGGAALFALAYVAFLGWQAPAARAGWLLALLAWSRWRQRHVGAIPLLAATCLMVLIADPWAVGDVGGWLSACALGGAIVLARWTDRTVGRAWTWRTLSGSVGATLGTAPITAMAFGQVALVGVVLNFIAIPLAAIAVPAVVAALIVYPVFPTMAGAFAAAGGASLAALEGVARVGAAVPFGQWIGEPGWRSAIPWVVALLAGAAVIHGRATLGEATRRLAWVGVTLSWGWLVASIPRPGTSGRLTLDFLDVGQGDATVIRTPHGRWIAIDAGPAGNGADAGRRVVVPFLQRHGARRIDLFVLSHAHRDHVGGATWLVRNIPVAVAIEPGEAFDDESYLAWLEAVAASKARWRTASTGQQWTIDGVRFEVLHPAARWPGRGLDLNESSVVLQVTYGSFSAVLTGDAGIPAEAEFGAATAGVDLLKVGHHGSRGATGPDLLAMMQPVAAVVSLGRNRYGHPAPETMRRLGSAGVRVWRTDRERTVRVSTDGSTFEVRGTRTSATFDAARPTRPRS